LNITGHINLAIDDPDPEGWVSEVYFDLDGIKKKHWYTSAAYAKRQARLLMRRKTSREPRPYVWRLGYNHCIGQFAGSDEYPRLSGSSLNRSLRDKKVKPARLFIEGPDKVPYQEPRVFSKRSRSKVKDKATAFWRALDKRRKEKPNRTFATFTFIEDIPDGEAVKVLNKFLTVLRKEKADLQYLWVAEPQEENHNRIHFHMLLDRRLDVRRYNALWVLQQYNSGLVGQSEKGEAYSLAEIRRRYDHDMNSEFKKHDPDGLQAILNPFDIEKATSITGLSVYLTQYITKQSKDHTFACQTWHCSRKVSKLFTKEIVGPSTFAYMLSPANWRVDTRTGEVRQEAKPIVQQFFTMVYINNKASPLSRLKQMEQVNKWIMQDFEPDRLPMFSTWLYHKHMANETEKKGGSGIYTTNPHTRNLARPNGRRGTAKKDSPLRE